MVFVVVVYEMGGFKKRNSNEIVVGDGFYRNNGEWYIWSDRVLRFRDELVIEQGTLVDN